MSIRFRFLNSSKLATRFLTSVNGQFRLNSSGSTSDSNKGTGTVQGDSKSKPQQRRDISLERNFITPIRAMNDFLLHSGDLQGLRKTIRRSPHTDEPGMTVYWRKDVEAKAIELHGSISALEAAKKKRDKDTVEYFQAISMIKKIMRVYRRGAATQHQQQTEIIPEKFEGVEEIIPKKSDTSILKTGAGKIVLTAVAINTSNFCIKLFAWWFTGSHSLFAESIHSLADTINQIILAYGIHKSTQEANSAHPYGFSSMRNVASLISGVGIFCVGAGLSFYHGITGLIQMDQIDSLYWAFYVLAGSMVSEGATLVLAINNIRKRAKVSGMTFSEFILRGQDPALNVVILEDAAALMGVVIAASSMALTMYLGSPVPDALGSLVIGGLLGGVASFIIYSNSAALVGKAISSEKLQKINYTLESDYMIRAVHDVKGIDMGNTDIRYKAEVDFDGRELTRVYLERIDLAKLLETVKSFQTQQDLENFMLQHGENIVDRLGAEIDRIERKLREENPEIRHCDLEIL